MNTINFFKLIFLIAIMQTGFSLPESLKSLNRPHFEYKSKLPPIPEQSKQYLNIANYNIRHSYNDKNSSDSWEKRRAFYIKTIQTEDEARQLMQIMCDRLKTSLSTHLSIDLVSTDTIEKEKECTTCEYSTKEPFPIYETKYYRLALKTSFDSNQILFGNFPYPYRLIIALKRHSFHPSEEEWKELQTILEVLDGKVSKDLGAEYTSYGVFQDVYFRKKNKNEITASTPHYFIHFIFRFPNGTTINDICFQDPNPYDQFGLGYNHLIKQDALKANSNFIYKRMPDIINIQELTFEQSQFLKKQLPAYRFIGYTAHLGLTLEEIKPDTWVQEILAIAYRPDRLECLDHGVRWISPTPNISSIASGASRERVLIWAKFKDNITKKEFFIFNAHYDHLGGKLEYVDSEVNSIKEIAKEAPWFSVGERFYKNFDGEKLYRHYLQSLQCYDVRDKSLFGHYGESGSFGGFEDDPFHVPVYKGKFGCDTLDVCFTNAKENKILLSYSFSGSYNPLNQKLYGIDELINTKYKLASDHFMTGFYVLLDDQEK